MKERKYIDGIDFGDWVEPSLLPNAESFDSNNIDDSKNQKPQKEESNQEPTIPENKSKTEWNPPPPPKHEQMREPRMKHDYESPRHEKSTPKQEGGFDLMSLLPLLGGLGGSGDSKGNGMPQMDMIMKLLNKDGGKGGSNDLMSMIPTLLPLIMNSGFLSPKKDNIPSGGKVINLDDYKQID